MRRGRPADELPLRNQNRTQATLIDTPAAFPIEKLYLQLGPVFDLDTMEWRQKKSKHGRRAQIGPAVVSALEGLRATKAIEFDECRRLCGKAVGKRDPRFERNVDDAFGVLTQLMPNNSDNTAIQSLCFGWLMPYWIIRRPKHQDIDDEFDSGRCDGEKPDARLKKALEGYQFTAGNER
jgi:hypothetical protein